LNKPLHPTACRINAPVSKTNRRQAAGEFGVSLQRAALWQALQRRIMVHRFLVTGDDRQLQEFHSQVCLWLNPIERRDKTIFYTCMDEDRALALRAAEGSSVTLEEICSTGAGEEYKRLVGSGPGWQDAQTAS
jgi:hypothetical protein